MKIFFQSSVDSAESINIEYVVDIRKIGNNIQFRLNNGQPLIWYYTDVSARNSDFDLLKNYQPSTGGNSGVSSGRVYSSSLAAEQDTSLRSGELYTLFGSPTTYAKIYRDAPFPSVTGLVAHWSADSGIMETGGVISSWADRISGNTMVSESNREPRLGTGQNGQTKVIADGNSKMATSTAISISGEWAVIVVGKNENDGSGQQSAIMTGQDYEFDIVGISATSGQCIFSDNYPNVESFASKSFAIAGFKFKDSRTKTWINNNALVETNGGSSIIPPLNVFFATKDDSLPEFSFKGDFYEIIFIDHAITDIEVGYFKQYFLSKYINLQA